MTESRNRRRGVGRPKSTIGSFDLSEHLRTAQEVLSDAALSQADPLRGAMAKHLSGNAPASSSFSQIINGHRPISEDFVNALHKAFVLSDAFRNEPAVRDLSWSIWIRKNGSDDNGEVGYELVPVSEFREILLAARASDPRNYLRPQATTPSWIQVPSTAVAQIQGAVGQQRCSDRPSVYLDEPLKFQVRMPFDGYLTMFGYDPDPESGPRPQLFWLDRLLGFAGVNLLRDVYVFPERGSGIPAGGRPSESALIGLAAKEPISLPWGSEMTGAVPLDRIRQVLSAFLRRPEFERSVAIFDFELERRRDQ